MNRLSKWLLVVLPLALLMVIVLPVLADEARGTIKSIKADDKEFVVTSDGKDLTFTLNKDGKVRLNDKDVKIKELRVGDKVQVTYEKKGAKMLVSEVKVKRD